MTPAAWARKYRHVNFIQDQLGHASLAVTDRYLRHVAPAARIEAIQRRGWSL